MNIMEWLFPKQIVDNVEKLKELEDQVVELEHQADYKEKEAELKKRVRDAKAKIAKANQVGGTSTVGSGGPMTAWVKKNFLVLVGGIAILGFIMKSCAG